MVLICFIFVLGVTIMIHELGHFVVAKKAGVYIYEFSLGMGPKIFSKKRKNDPTEYNIRLFPIGGFVSMAGEDLETDQKIPKENQLCNKSWIARFATLIAGIVCNFLLAIILLFIVGLCNGVPKYDTKIAYLNENYPIYNTSIEVGDNIKKINNTKINSSEMLVLELAVYSGKEISLQVEHQDGTLETVKVKPIYTERDGQKGYAYGFNLDNTKEKGFLPAIQYAFKQTKNLITQMGKMLYYLITGKLGLDNLSGPVGIYTIVGTAASAGFLSILYLIAYLCINAGLINLIPLPAFDGGRILFLIIEKIKGTKVNPKIENTIHTIGFMLLMVLMIYVTYHDILRIFK